MKVDHIILFVMYCYLIIFFSIFFLTYKSYQKREILDDYKMKIELSTIGSMRKKFSGLSDVAKSQISRGDISKTDVNYEKMWESFRYLLNLNFNKTIVDTYDKTMFVDKYVVIENDHMMINAEIDSRKENKHIWLLPVSYVIEDKDDCNKDKHVFYKFTLDNKYKRIDTNIDSDYLMLDDLEKEEKERLLKLKNEAIIGTIRRNITMYGKDEKCTKEAKTLLINIPYEDNSYNTIKNKSVIVTFRDFPIINNEKVDIISMSAGEIKEVKR